MTGPVKKGRYFVGSVGVDAGVVWVGDPCYIKNNPEIYVDFGRIHFFKIYRQSLLKFIEK